MVTTEQKAQLLALLQKQKEQGIPFDEMDEKALGMLGKEFAKTSQSPFQGAIDEAVNRFNLSAIKTVPGAQKKFLENKFGKDNVLEQDGVLFAKPEGVDQFLAVNPSPDAEKGASSMEAALAFGLSGGNVDTFKDSLKGVQDVLNNPDLLAEIVETIPTALRGLLTVGGGIGGAVAGGSSGQPVLGSALGTAAGTALGDLGSASYAGVMGAIPEGTDLRGEIAGKAGLAGAGDLLTGGALKIIASNPATKAAITKGMKALGKSTDEIKNTLNTLRNEYFDKSFAKKMERFKVGGEVADIKVKTQEMQMLKGIEDRVGSYVPKLGNTKALNSLGEQAQKAVNAEIDEISKQANNLFNKTGALVQQKAKQGNLGSNDFADATLFTDQFSKELDELAADPMIANNQKALGYLGNLKNKLFDSLNDTVKNAPRETQAKLGYLKFMGSPKRRDPLGMLVNDSSLKKDVSFEFNPKLVTARDLHKAKQALGEGLDNLQSFTDVPKNTMSRILARAKKQVDDALGSELDGVLLNNDTFTAPVENYSKGLIKAPKGQTFALFKKGYKTLQDGFERLPTNVRKQVLGDVNEKGIKEGLNPSSAQQNVLALDYEDAQKLGKIAQKQLKGRDKLVYNRSLEGQVLEKGVRNKTLPDISPTKESIEQAKFITPKELKEAQKQGVALKSSPVMRSQKEKLLQSEFIPTIAAGSADTLSNKSMALQGLLESSEKSRVKDSLKNLGALQQKRGVQDNFQTLTAAMPALRSTAGVIGGSPLSFATGGVLQALEKTGRPLIGNLSPVASALENVPGGLLGQQAGDLLMSDNLGEPTEEQKKRYQLSATKKRLLD